ncbi:GTA-gp10 family protein [Cloacibacillus sp. An23]|uniref:GTA-gp10 family protein n=1 Tax=Cloacibacillus sp. An23 TaxID=1965591 RepID=UPI000B3A6F11|nr:GTA-gp10 family protein [Cloacibacillus sp. An23]OUO92568.1 hypothetical protein B5F39_10425 [Cloacibacillus sp. An23]
MREVTINGKNYKIEFGLNAVCMLEDTMHQPLSAIMQQISNGVLDLRLIRAIFWAVLLANNRGMTLERAGAILDQADGDYPAVYADIVGELTNSFVLRIIPLATQNGEDAKNAEGTA